jgi:DNA repair protein RadC
MSQKPTKPKSIKSWSADDRPREKMLAKGRQHMSDSELLAIILGSGSVGESAVELAKRILSDHQNNLNELGKISHRELVKKYKGIGDAKAINILAALELGRRRQAAEPIERNVIKSSRDAFDILYPVLADLPHEEFWVLYCNRASKVLHTQKIGAGGLSAVTVDTKVIVQYAISWQATTIILVHNHPSGSLKPSSHDMSLTEKVKAAARLFDIFVTDHIIIAENKYFSFADEGLM